MRSNPLNSLLAFMPGKKSSSSDAEAEKPGSLIDIKRTLELLIFAFAAPLVGAFLFPQDPLGMSAGFPWAAVGPVAFAARYGVTWGAACALATAIAILFPHAVYQVSFAMNIAMAIGTLVLSIIVGDASTSWRERAGRATAENQYLRHRLKEFSNDYHVLKVSHGQLEEYMAGQKLSLRQALQQLKPVLSTNRHGLEAGAELMAVLAQFCSVQVAGLYAMRGESTVNPKAVAIHGNMGELPIFDKMLRVALKERKLVSIKLDMLADDKYQDGLLAVVPIVDSSNRIHGVLAIRDMHFMAFQQENLNLLSLLGGYIGDMLSRSRGMAGSRGAWFLAELDTALRFARTNSVKSSVICLKLKRFEGDVKLANFISTNLRSLDASWQPKTRDGSQLIVILLPLISRKQADGYLSRLVKNVEREYGIGLVNVATQCRVKQIDRSVSRELCMDFIQNKVSSENLRDRLGKRSDLLKGGNDDAGSSNNFGKVA